MPYLHEERFIKPRMWNAVVPLFFMQRTIKIRLEGGGGYDLGEKMKPDRHYRQKYEGYVRDIKESFMAHEFALTSISSLVNSHDASLAKHLAN